jgi:hypothetical protein
MRGERRRGRWPRGTKLRELEATSLRSARFSPQFASKTQSAKAFESFARALAGRADRSSHGTRCNTAAQAFPALPRAQIRRGAAPEAGRSRLGGLRVEGCAAATLRARASPSIGCAASGCSEPAAARSRALQRGAQARAREALWGLPNHRAQRVPWCCAKFSQLERPSRRGARAHRRPPRAPLRARPPPRQQTRRDSASRRAALASARESTRPHSASARLWPSPAQRPLKPRCAGPCAPDPPSDLVRATRDMSTPARRPSLGAFDASAAAPAKRLEPAAPVLDALDAHVAAAPAADAPPHYRTMPTPRGEARGDVRAAASSAYKTMPAEAKGESRCSSEGAADHSAVPRTRARQLTPRAPALDAAPLPDPSVHAAPGSARLYRFGLEKASDYLQSREDAEVRLAMVASARGACVLSRVSRVVGALSARSSTCCCPWFPTRSRASCTSAPNPSVARSLSSPFPPPPPPPRGALSAGPLSPATPQARPQLLPARQPRCRRLCHRPRSSRSVLSAAARRTSAAAAQRCRLCLRGWRARRLARARRRPRPRTRASPRLARLASPLPRRQCPLQERSHLLRPRRRQRARCPPQ